MTVRVPLSQGKGDMVTYWLEAKKTSGFKGARCIAMETETEGEAYSSLPGFLTDDLLLDTA